MMPLGAPVEAPWGFISLCGRSPIDCVAEDTPQARARAVLTARAVARARWDRAMQLAASRGVLSRPAVAASVHGERAAATRLWRSPETGRAEPADAEQSAAERATADAAGGDPVRIELDQRSWDALNRLNTQVNHAIHPASDTQVYGVSDWWVAPLASGVAPYGDCKDYALEKRRELIAAGVPARALSLALADTAWGELHAVLVVATRQGDYVLDNLDRHIRLWSRTPYLWRSRQSPNDPMVWLAVEAPGKRS